MTSRTCLLTLSIACALPAAEARAGGASPVRYSKVDASTVRVFAVGTVGVTTIDGPEPIQVAAPQAGHGTGFAVEPDLVITARHVIAGARHVVVRRPGNGGFAPARVVYSSAGDDIAVLQVDTKLPRIRMREDRSPLRVRQTVFAVGYPLDPSRTQAQSARGIIAGHLDDTSLQLDISLNPGNSGGPLVDERDFVVGMVIARGDVKKGVQGIGVAVPIRKLRAALARAHREVAAGNVPALSDHEALNAAIVDHLVRTGTVVAFGDQVDLGGGFDGRDLDRQIDQLVSRVDDSDLLVFLAANLWNTSLTLEHRKIRALGGKALSAQEARKLAGRMRLAAVRLARRGSELDRSIGERSRFVGLALGAVTGETATAGADNTDELDDPDTELVAVPAAPRAVRVATASAPEPGSATAVTAVAAPRAPAQAWAFTASPQLRLGSAGERAYGGGVALGRRLISDSPAPIKLFGSVGLAAGMVSGDEAHSFAAVELGGGVRIALGRASALELSGGIAPSYSATSRDILMMHHESAYVLDHYRAGASLSIGRLAMTAGVRSIQSTWWLEPIGLGVKF